MFFVNLQVNKNVNTKTYRYQTLDFLIIYPLITLVSFIATFAFVIFQYIFFESFSSIFESAFLELETTLFFILVFIFFYKEVYQTNVSKKINYFVLWMISIKVSWVLNPPFLFVFYYENIKKKFNI